jgi:hypothetical protein
MLELLFEFVGQIVGEMVGEAIARPIKRWWRRSQAARRRARFAVGKTVSVLCSLRRPATSPRWMQGSLELGAGTAVWHHKFGQTKSELFPRLITVCTARRRAVGAEAAAVIGRSVFLFDKLGKRVDIAIRRNDEKLLEDVLSTFSTHSRA